MLNLGGRKPVREIDKCSIREVERDGVPDRSMMPALDRRRVTVKLPPVDVYAREARCRSCRFEARRRIGEGGVFVPATFCPSSIETVAWYCPPLNSTAMAPLVLRRANSKVLVPPDCRNVPTSVASVIDSKPSNFKRWAAACCAAGRHPEAAD